MLLAACDANVTSVGAWIADVQEKLDAPSEIGDAEPPLPLGESEGRIEPAGCRRRRWPRIDRFLVRQPDIFAKLA